MTPTHEKDSHEKDPREEQDSQDTPMTTLPAPEPTESPAPSPTDSADPQKDEDTIHDAAEPATDTDSTYLTHTRKRQARILGLAWFIGVGLIGAIAASTLIVPPPQGAPSPLSSPSSPAATNDADEARPQPLPATIVSAHPSSLTLGCLDASIDPFAPLGVEDTETSTNGQAPRAVAATLWRPSSAIPTEFLLGGEPAQPPTLPDGRAWALTTTLPASNNEAGAPASAETTTELPHGVSLVGQKGGELRGLSLLPCTPAALEHWFAAGATSSGEDMVIRLANVGSQPSVVTLAAWGARGPLDQLSQGLVVGAGETLSIQPGRYFPNEERLLLRLNADGPGVSAWLHSSAINGEIPQGSAWVGSTLPSTQLVIPGLTAQGAHSLRLAVPSLTASAQTAAPTAKENGAGEEAMTAQAEVTLRLIDTAGTHDIPGGTLSLAEHSVLDIDLPALTETSTLVIESTLPVVSQIRTLYPGTQWPTGAAQPAQSTAESSAQRWTGRGLLTPSTPIRALSIPAATEMTTALTRAFDAAIIRPTSVTTPAESSIASQDILLINPTPEPLTARYGEEEKNIPAGSSMTLPLAGTQKTLSVEEGLHAAILIRAELPTGNLDAVWPLGNVAMSGFTRALDLR